MIFRRRNLDLASVPAEALAAEIARRGLAVLSPAAAGALQLEAARHFDRERELQRLLDRERARVARLEDKLEKWWVRTERASSVRTREVIEADRLASIVAAPGIYGLEELLISETD